MNNLIKVKQIDSGDLNNFVNGIVSTTSGFLQDEINALLTTSAYSASQPLISGVSGQFISFTGTFNSAPRVVAQLVNTGITSPFISLQVAQRTISGCQVNFSMPIPNNGYSVDVILFENPAINTNTTQFTSGSLSGYLPFGVVYTGIPRVVVDLRNDHADPFVSYYINNKTVSGCYISFSNALTTANYYADVISTLD